MLVLSSLLVTNRNLFIYCNLRAKIRIHRYNKERPDQTQNPRKSRPPIHKIHRLTTKRLTVTASTNARFTFTNIKIFAFAFLCDSPPHFLFLFFKPFLIIWSLHQFMEFISYHYLSTVLVLVSYLKLLRLLCPQAPTSLLSNRKIDTKHVFFTITYKFLHAAVSN